MAEYYGIFDLRSVTLETQAVLAMGLPENSRTMMAISGRTVSTDTILLAGILDQLRLQAWGRSKAAKNKASKPKSILAALVERKEKKESDIMAFDSGADFKAYREALLKGMKNGELN